MEREIGIAVWASRLWRKVLVRSGRLLMSRRATSNEKPLLSAAGGGCDRSERRVGLWRGDESRLDVDGEECDADTHQARHERPKPAQV